MTSRCSNGKPNHSNCLSSHLLLFPLVRVLATRCLVVAVFWFVLVAVFRFVNCLAGLGPVAQRTALRTAEPPLLHDFLIIRKVLRHVKKF